MSIIARIREAAHEDEAHILIKTPHMLSKSVSHKSRYPYHNQDINGYPYNRYYISTFKNPTEPGVYMSHSLIYSGIIKEIISDQLIYYLSDSFRRENSH